MTFIASVTVDVFETDIKCLQVCLRCFPFYYRAGNDSAGNHFTCTHVYWAIARLGRCYVP